MLVVVVVVGALAGLARPRRARFAAPRLVALVFVAAVVHALSVTTSGTLHAVMLGASILCGVLWIATQRRHLASVLLGIGVCLNLAVVVANGGMPVDSAALAGVGRPALDVTRGFLGKHVAMTADTRLAWLGDRIPVPVQHNVISIGDVLMGVAICLWVADSVGGWWSERRSAGPVHREHRRGARREVVGDSE